MPCPHPTSIARLVELYAFLKRLQLIGYGSTTFRLEAKERGAEPDECYCLGHPIKQGDFPDIVLEVIYTTPILDKLSVYAGFGVPESGCSARVSSSSMTSMAIATITSSAADSCQTSTSRSSRPLRRAPTRTPPSTSSRHSSGNSLNLLPESAHATLGATCR